MLSPFTSQNNNQTNKSFLFVPHKTMASTVLCNSSINSSTIVFSRTHFPLLVSKDFPIEFPPYIHFNHHFKTRTNNHKKKLLHVKAQVVEAPTVSPPPVRFLFICVKGIWRNCQFMNHRTLTTNQLLFNLLGNQVSIGGSRGFVQDVEQ